MPQAIEPPAGFVVNANNDPAGADARQRPAEPAARRAAASTTSAPGFDFGTRGGRVTQRAPGGDSPPVRSTRATWQAIQADVVLARRPGVRAAASSRAFDAARAAGAPEALRGAGRRPARRRGRRAAAALAPRRRRPASPTGYDARDWRGRIAAADAARGRRTASRRRSTPSGAAQAIAHRRRSRAERRTACPQPGVRRGDEGAAPPRRARRRRALGRSTSSAGPGWRSPRSAATTCC
ncbi:MAG: hypothetical protein MZW92_74865 [Comamonadaceae bacterium]|nr:hypothetical protein [Comamonadaceae bacterium]